MRLWLPAILISTAMVLTYTACGGGDESPDAGPSPACLEAQNHSDIGWLEDNVFTPSCAAFTACHKGRALSANELNLEKGNVEMNLVNQMHSEFTSETLVVPGSPETSYLMVLLGDRPGTLNEAGTMPFNNPLLCKEKRDAIARWITNLGTQSADAGVGDGGM
jgi:hypothetical protein